jgi:PhzF family phenazine biosynthesis protein
MQVERIAAFTADGKGGNPAGVVVGSTHPAEAEMQQIARDLGYSETVFAASQTDGRWRVRYFSPEAEVAFCGHATVALGAVLGHRFGAGRFELVLNGGEISVEAGTDGRATLTSPPTRSALLAPALRDEIMGLFGLVEADLDPALAPRMGNAGNDHPIFLLRERRRLKAMAYPFDVVKALMARENLTTICLVWRERNDLFHVRNAFAIGGVVEDPATGAAAAALAGALVDARWPGLVDGGRFTILQGEDMGAPSLLEVEVTGLPGDRVRVSGAASEIRG